jgi:membrane-bound lytic murein transglycosylase D
LSHKSALLNIQWVFHTLAVAGCFLACLDTSGQTSDTAVSGATGSPSLAWSIDSLMRLKLFEYASSRKETVKGSTGSITVYPDMFFEYKFEELNRTSLIHFTYNEQVKKYIDLYTVQRRNELPRILGLAEMYFPLFEEYLARYNLPLEFKYLPVIESSLNPLARSSSDAIGLWQLKLSEARLFNLEVNSLVDERCDPRKSTDAACRYIAYLYSTFRDWQLVLAAFNGGPGVVRNAIARSGGKTDFWTLRNYMPKQTQDYVPAFMAAGYVMNYSKEHNIYPQYPIYNFWNTDTVMINHPLDLRQVSEIIGIPVEGLQFLNPEYKTGLIPETGQPMVLQLPSDKVLTFIERENDIIADKVLIEDYHLARKNAAITDGKECILYTVQPGDFLHRIAIAYNCSLEDIKAWNGLTSNDLNPGQQLKLYFVPGTIPPDSIILSRMKKPAALEPTFISHTITEGETIWSIAARYPSTTAREIMDYNHISDIRKLKSGDVIKIPLHN